MIKLLSEIYQNGLVSFEEGFDKWQDAICASCKTLEAKGYTDKQYAQAIIKCIEEFGPYIVIAPMIAMPHSTLGAQGVYKTGISFMVVKKPVSFDVNDKEKDARLFFTLAANSHEEHLNNMMQLSEMLMNEELVKELLELRDENDLKILIEKY